MMSIISQNAIPKEHTEKTKRKAAKNELLHGEEESEDGQKFHSDTTKTKQRKKERMEVNEQEKEMKKLENFLFGSLYSPVEFGKDLAACNVTGKSSALFFTDSSGNNMMSAYEDDAEFSEEMNDVEEVAQRKPVCVDEEEEQTSINIAKVNRLRKLRKEEGESVISGSAYVSTLRAQHVKLNPGTE